MTENHYIDRDDVLGQITAQWTTRHPDYAERKRELKKRLAELSHRLDAIQDAGHPMACSEQRLLEAGWLLNYRDDWDYARARLDALEASLAETGQKPLSQGRTALGATGAARRLIASWSPRSTRCSCLRSRPAR